MANLEHGATRQKAQNVGIIVMYPPVNQHVQQVMLISAAAQR